MKACRYPKRLRTGRDEGGQALVELAVVLVIFLTLLMGIIETARIGYTYITVLSASREAARIGILGKSDLQISNTARNSASILDKDKLAIYISPPSSQRKRGDALEVKITYPLEFIVPMSESLFGDVLQVTGSTVMRIE